MRRALLPAAVLALLLVLALILGSALGRPDSATLMGGAARVEQVDTGAFPEISLYVSVADEAGNPRAGLSSDDFKVTEDGVSVEIASFGGAGAGSVSSVLVIDRSLSMEEEDKIEGAREAAAAFVELLRPGDRASLIAFNDEIELPQAFTDDQEELEWAIERLRPNGGTALYDAVVAGVELLRDEPGRRLLVVLSDGQDCSVPFDSCPDEAGSEHTLDEAIAYAQAAGQPVAVVGLGDRASSGDNGIDETVLRQIAEETGGRYLYAPQGDDLASLYAGLAGDVQREYRLTYVSSRPFYDGTRRDIEVLVGSTVAAGGYTERHLINVVSSPLVGLALLVPLAGLLVLPGALAARRRASVAAAGAGDRSHGAPLLGATLATPGVPAAHVPAVGSTLAAHTSAVQVALASPEPTTITARRCASCDASLRPGARFCARCGAVQPPALTPAPPAERRTFCDMCGQPLNPGAKFCMACGEPARARSGGAEA